jgi:hypothetical protein
VYLQRGGGWLFPCPRRPNSHNTATTFASKGFRPRRRALTLEALAGADKKALARRYGVSRRGVYQLLNEALDDPKGNRDEAEKELKFR